MTEPAPGPATDRPMAITTIARARNLAIVLGGTLALAACVWAGLGPGRARKAPATPVTPADPVDDLARLALPGSEGPGADDLLALGVGLIARGRTAEGRVALEASRRIGPDHEATRRALDDLEADLAARPGRIGRRSCAAAVEVEHFRSIQGGPALDCWQWDWPASAIPRARAAISSTAWRRATAPNCGRSTISPAPSAWSRGC